MASVTTPIGILSFPALFTPKRNKENPTQAPRYSCILLFDEVGVQSTAYKTLRKAVHETIVEKWGAAKAADPAFVRRLRLPFRDASEKTYKGFENGKIYISPWSQGDGQYAHRPDVVDLKGSKILVPEDVFAGQLARATVRPFAYDNNGNMGVSLGLEHVQIVKADMPRIDGRQSGDKAFRNADNDQLAALGIDPGSAGGLDDDDDIPF